jgi:histidinol-phosphatase (PHP family)
LEIVGENCKRYKEMLHLRGDFSLVGLVTLAMLLASMTWNLADYHTHTVLCHHASGTPCEYVQQAQRSGLTEMGFSCHSPMRSEFDDWRMSIDDLPRYFEMVEEARVFGLDMGVTVRLGLEVDFLPGHEAWIEELASMASWDYLIGSVHYLTDSLVVDHPEHISQLRNLSAERVWESYWQRYTEAIHTGLFDIMGHPDLPKKFGMIPEGDLANYYEPAITAMAQVGNAFEINTAGIRKPIAEVYPTPEFLKLAHTARVPLVISSDAHATEEVAGYFGRAVTEATVAGYTQTAHFHQRERTLVDL